MEGEEGGVGGVVEEADVRARVSVLRALGAWENWRWDRMLPKTMVLHAGILSEHHTELRSDFGFVFVPKYPRCWQWKQGAFMLRQSTAGKIIVAAEGQRLHLLALVSALPLLLLLRLWPSSVVYFLWRQFHKRKQKL